MAVMRTAIVVCVVLGCACPNAPAKRKKNDDNNPKRNDEPVPAAVQFLNDSLEMAALGSNYTFKNDKGDVTYWINSGQVFSSEVKTRQQRYNEWFQFQKDSDVSLANLPVTLIPKMPLDLGDQSFSLP